MMNEAAPSPAPDDGVRDVLRRLIDGDAGPFVARAAERGVEFALEESALATLRLLNNDDPDSWLRLRAKLKAAKVVGLTQLDAALKGGSRTPPSPASGPVGPVDNRPRLLIERHSPDKTVAALRDILASAGQLFERHEVVKVSYDVTKDGVLAHAMSAPALVLATHEVCRPYVVRLTRDGTEEVDVALPQNVANMYLDYRNWRLPPFNGVASAPLLAEDGSIRAAEGYDAATGMWCERIPPVADLVPERPSEADARAALLTIRNHFKSFCYADSPMVREGVMAMVDVRKAPGMDESAFLVSLTTAVCRASLHLAPGTFFRAAQASGAGAGKGKLARCICAIAFGRQPSAVTAGGSREEQEKRIATEFLEGGPAVFLDNFNGLTIRSPTLESVLTERPSKIRVFGKLRTAPVNAVAWLALTGNGSQLASDLVRRLLTAEFDAFMEDPEQRAFASDALVESIRRRGELLTAVLTIWRWGRRTAIAPGRTLGSYEQWGRWARDPLLALGCQDPVERISETKKRDPSRQAIAAVFLQWSARHGAAPTTANDLHDDVKALIDPQGRGRQFLATAVEKLAGTRLGGFVLTRQAALGQWSAATYQLQEAPADTPSLAHENAAATEGHRTHRTHRSEKTEKTSPKAAYGSYGSYGSYAFGSRAEENLEKRGDDDGGRTEL
jgi:hypothetical protein